MEIVLFTTHCPRCRILDIKLKEKGIKYIECTDVDEMIKLGIKSTPYIKVDGKLLNFSEAINWIKEQ